MKSEEGKEAAVLEEKGAPPAQMDIVTYALQNNASPEQIEKMMELSERHEKNEARKAYHVAMANFKANPPKIDKDASVKYGQTAYKHATLANVTGKINKALSEHGLSASWQTEQKEKEITVICKITHILGHSESTSLTAPADTSGAKNAIQAIGSTVAYLQRYTILSLAGLATSEMDDDGQTSEEVECLSKEQIEILNKVIEEKGVDLGMLLSYMEAESLDLILAADFKKAERAVDLAKGKQK